MKGRNLWLQRKRRHRQATAAVAASAESRTLAAEEINKAAAKRPAAVIEQKVAGSPAAARAVDKVVRPCGETSII
jgi:hypothetical protein